MTDRHFGLDLSDHHSDDSEQEEDHHSSLSPSRKRRRLRRANDDENNTEENNVINVINEEVEEERNYVIEEERAHFSSEEDEENIEGEDLMEHQETDYRRMETLDRYDTRMLDDRKYESIDFDTRKRVEEELNRRDAREGRIQQVFQEDNELERDDAHRRRLRRDQDPMMDDTGRAGIEEEEIINLEHFDVPLREWIASERPRNEIKRRFKNFLNTFTADDSSKKSSSKTLVYHQKIVKLAQRNEQSLEIEIGDIIHTMSMIAAWIVEAPKDMIAILEEVTKEVVLGLFPYYDKIHSEIYVRILDLPGTEKLRDLRTAHLNFLIKVSGVVTRRTSVFPQLQMVKYNCVNCRCLLGPFSHSSNHKQEIQLNSCPECQSKGPFSINSEETIYRNYQRITLQESPGSVPAGRVPRSKEVVLLADLIDKARPGDEVSITGVYLNINDTALNVRHGFPVFRTVIEANYLQKKMDLMSVNEVLTSQEKKTILNLAKDPQIAQKIIRSIAPSIYGHEFVKTALAMSMFGGKPKFIKNSRVRGDINVLMVGDPGTAKSQFLKYCQATAPRCVFSTGKGASAVGLTAGVHKDPMTKEWTLQGGALVLADRGMCLIDEFDKMNDGDRTSIHEAMEQQSISISKAGIVTSLQARCSIVAAANPIGGRYNSARTFAENVELTDPILQRFDILCVLVDRVDPVEDERLANFVIDSHIKHNPSNTSQPEGDVDQENSGESAIDSNSFNRSLSLKSDDDIIEQDLLKKYLLYARTFCNPTVGANVDTRKIETYYAQLRKASQHTGAVPIAVRHLESLFRMAEAYARMHLRENVRDEDFNMAIRTMTDSLCQAQKFTFKRQWQQKFRQYLTYQQDNNSLLLHLLNELFQAAHTYQQLRSQRPNSTSDVLQVLCSDLATKAKTYGIYNLFDFYSSKQFTSHGFQLDEVNKTIKRFF